MINAWQDERFAKDYAAASSDLKLNWYEHQVNFPALVRLLPADASKLLDFGCGPGDFTALIAKTYSLVRGCDQSDAMLELARKMHPSIDFFSRNGATPFARRESYDAIFSKATIHFISNLNQFASNIRSALVPKGTLVFSVPHPYRVAIKVPNYWQVQEYYSQIGKYKLKINMIHRPLSSYIDPFITNGFIFAKTCLAQNSPGSRPLAR